MNPSSLSAKSRTHLAKIAFLILVIFSCSAAVEEGNNGLRIDAVNSRSRVPPYVNFRNEIPTVFYENAAGNKFSNEGVNIGGYLNSGNLPNDIPQSYSFDYKATDEEGNVHYREEQSDASGVVRGSYGYTDVEGLYRTVSYVADATGFHVFIATNEPGMSDKESPADVDLRVSDPPASIQEKYNAFRGTGVGGLKPFGSRIGTGGFDINRGTMPSLQTDAPGNVYLGDVAFTYGGTVNDSHKPGQPKPKEVNDNYDEENPKK